MRLVKRQVWRFMADHSEYLGEMVQDKDAKKSEGVIKAMLQMKKLDIQGLTKAYAEG